MQQAAASGGNTEPAMQICKALHHVVEVIARCRWQRWIHEHQTLDPRVAAPVQHRMVRSRSEEHTSELQSPDHLVCRLLLEKKKTTEIASKPESGQTTVHAM